LDRFVFVGERDWRLFRKIIFFRKLYLIRNGVDVGPLRPVPKKDGLVYLGRISPEKNILSLIKAAETAKVNLDLYGPFDRRDGEFRETVVRMVRDTYYVEWKGPVPFEAVAMVKRKHPDIKLLLVGEGILKGKMEEMCEALDLQENVMFLGDRSDVPDLLSRIDFFVLPSLWEGLPISLLEASASKLPVIATKVSGSEEVVIDGKTGILVPPGDPSALSLAITWMIENRKKAKAMGDEGRKRVKENFNIRTAVKTYEELYEYIYKYKLSSKKK